MGVRSTGIIFMERRPNTAIKQLRLILGRTQEKFAFLIGVSKHAVINWENGRNGLSPEVARRIEWATGAMARDLLANQPPRDASGQPITRETIEKRMRTTREDEVELTIKYCLADFKKLLRAAGKAGEDKDEFRLVDVEEKFRRWFHKTIHDFDLYEEIFRLYRPLDRITMKQNLNEAFPHRQHPITEEEFEAERVWQIKLKARLRKEFAKPKPKITS